MSKKIKVLRVVETTFGEGHKVLVVRVDNGTGHLDLMPETAIRDTEVPVKSRK